jgi:DNA invertase Pin-like site-specific DNA recombinase
MSIESQIKEMSELAQKEGLTIKEVRKESHSAKESGQRPVFKQLLSEIKEGAFTGILTWAPDRLSRNAGDLGQLVDLMDQGKITNIKTFTQGFSDTPSDKFLLMILCSQAKLENDQKGVNVKRGIRAKCEMGWRPGMPPLGYYNRAFNGIKDILVDPDRGPLIKELFGRVAGNGDSGRTVKKWFDKKGLTTRAGKKVPLSMVYQMLKNSFYYGEFEYPIGGGNWYKGKHTPLITKAIFDKIQKQLEVPRKAKWNSKGFAFKELMKCANCKASVVGEEKYRKQVSGEVRRHVYYHCSRSVDYSCKEKYINEEEVVKQLIKMIDSIDEKKLNITEKIEGAIMEYRKVGLGILRQENIEIQDQTLGIKGYSKYVLREGSNHEKADFMFGLHLPLILKNGHIEVS